MATEARTIEYVCALGYPVPFVDELSDDGTDIVLERLDGRVMVDEISARPWTIRRHGAILADLHRRLHELPAPDWLGAAPCGHGDRLLHLDLHPLNVLITSRGPVVIDWTNARRGDGNVDLALSWVLIAAAEPPTNRAVGLVLGLARKQLLQGMLTGVDRPSVAAHLAGVVDWKVSDPNMSAVEQAAMRALVDRET